MDMHLLRQSSRVYGPWVLQEDRIAQIHRVCLTDPGLQIQHGCLAVCGQAQYRG